jgi:hypothetical protein
MFSQTIFLGGEMFRKSLFGLISFVIILAWLVSPIAALAQDVTPTDPPVDIPNETLPVTDVPTEVVPEVLPLDVLPTDVAPVETVVPTEVIVAVPESAVSLVDVTNALVDTAATVSTGDPSGFLNATAAASASTKLLTTIDPGTPFSYLFTVNEGGAPPDGTCNYDGVTVTCYWATPVQQAVRDARAGTDVRIESGAVFNENVIIGYDMFNNVTICGPDSCPSGLVSLIAGPYPTLNGFISINNVHGFRVESLTINGYVNVVDSEGVDVYNVTVNPADDSTGVSISGSSDVSLSYSTINKEGFADAVSISNSDGVTLGGDEIYVSDPHGYGNVGWGISANEVTDLSIYDSTIDVRDGAQGGINVADSSGSLLIGGDGYDMGAYAPGQGLLVEMTNPANNSVGINVQNFVGDVFIGNGVRVDSFYDSQNPTGGISGGPAPYNTSGVCINNIHGSVFVGLNSEINIIGGNGTGISVNGVYSPDFSTDAFSMVDPLVDLANGVVAIGENLAVNLYELEPMGALSLPLGVPTPDLYFGGNGIGIEVNGVAGLTILGSLQDWLTYSQIPFGWVTDSDSESLPWGGEHQTDINVYGTPDDSFSPRIGLAANGNNAIFASGINTNASDGIGAVFGSEYLYITALTDLFSGNSGPLYIANSTFNDSGQEGLIVNSQDGDVTVDNIQANGNEWSSFTADSISSFGVGSLLAGADFSYISGDLSISNSEFMGNFGNGLNAFADGEVNITNVESGWNGMDSGGSGIFIGTGIPNNVNILNSYIHDNNGDGIIFATWYDFTQTQLSVPLDQPLYQPYAANVLNTKVVNNQGTGLDYYGMGTLTVCGGSLSGNGENIYVELPGVLVQDPYYPCGWTEDVQTPGISPIVVNVEFSTGSPGQGSADVAPDRGLIFNLLDKSNEGAEVLLAQAALPMGSVPGGSHAGFEQKLETSLPAALPDGVSFVGPAFTLAFTLPDGTPVTTLDETMQVKFKIPDGFTVPSGQALAIYLYDTSGAWVKLPVTISDGYVYAFTNLLGTFGLALAPAS